jgi:hypothetical protein
MDWSSHYPAYVNPDSEQTTLSGAPKLLKDVEVVDIGCGFGGLLVGLAPLLPETLMLGMFGSAMHFFIYHPAEYCEGKDNMHILTLQKASKSAPKS